MFKTSDTTQPQTLCNLGPYATSDPTQPAGDEVAVSYLGREEFAPADARQEVLQQRWGFKCTCERCRVEAAAPQELRSVINESYVRVMQVRKMTPVWGSVGGATLAVCRWHVWSGV